MMYLLAYAKMWLILIIPCFKWVDWATWHAARTVFSITCQPDALSEKKDL